MPVVIELLKALLFGIVEGITEWLPISSTGHMLLLEKFVVLDVSPAFWHMFLVVIQLGAILAVCVSFFKELNPFAFTLTKAQRSSIWTLWAKIIVACIPAAVIGIPLDDWMDEHLSSPFVIAAALVVYGVVFLCLKDSQKDLSAHAGKHAKVVQSEQRRHTFLDKRITTHAIDKLSWKQTIGIGCFQVLSIIPGTSRSGSTIIGALLMGCSRSVAAQFTFYLAVPVMVGASGLRLVKFFIKGNTFSTMEAATLAVGCLVAFLVSMAVVKFLMRYIKRHDFSIFGWYRIALGIAVATYFWLI